MERNKQRALSSRLFSALRAMAMISFAMFLSVNLAFAQDKVKITLRNNTDIVLVSFDARIYYYGARKNYYQTFNTRSGRYMYTIIQPHETKTFKIPKVRGISDNPFYRVEFVLQGYAKYDDYSRIYR
mgnify:CR=1 FL=1